MKDEKQGKSKGDVQEARMQIEQTLDALLSQTNGKYREVSRASILASVERAIAW